jgi:hypothetical protein
VHGGDGRLQLIRADRASGQRLGDKCHTLGNRVAIPQRAVLLIEWNQLARGADARWAARVGQ